MNLRRSAIPALSVLCLALGSPSWAWGPVGHEAIGIIAQDFLTAPTLSRIQTILPNVTLAQIANCADQFREGDRNCAGAFTMVGDPSVTADWHYMNIPENAQVNAQTMMKYCPNGDCVTVQLNKNIAILQNRVGKAIDQQMAFVNTVHFAGDAHQPLHAATGVPDDKGGNEKIMKMLPGKPNLHRTWDDVIFDPRNAQTLASALLADLKGKDTSSWTTGAVDSFAATAVLEGLAIAHNTIYPDYARTGGNDLLQPYQKQMQPIAYLRIQKAGVRLAHILNTVMGQ